MPGSGLVLSMMQNNVTSSTPEAPFMSDAGWDTTGTLGSAAVSVWSTLAKAKVAQRMKQDLANYNNSMRAVIQGVKQFTADKNRIATGDAHVNADMAIELDRMRAESQVTSQAAFIGASSSAKRAAMFDIDRNAVTAKFNQAAQFENALQQIQLTEYSENMQQVATHQNAADTSPSAFSTGLGAVLNLGKESIKSGAWDKGSKLRTGFADLFNSDAPTLPLD